MRFFVIQTVFIWRYVTKYEQTFNFIKFLLKNTSFSIFRRSSSLVVIQRIVDIHCKWVFLIFSYFFCHPISIYNDISWIIKAKMHFWPKNTPSLIFLSTWWSLLHSLSLLINLHCNILLMNVKRFWESTIKMQ